MVLCLIWKYLQLMMSGQHYKLVFHATFNNIWVTLWRSVLLVKKTGVQKCTLRKPPTCCKSLTNGQHNKVRFYDICILYSICFTITRSLSVLSTLHKGSSHKIVENITEMIITHNPTQLRQAVVISLFVQGTWSICWHHKLNELLCIFYATFNNISVVLYLSI